ncbi:MAG TPA: GNAT family N-acetyltransferase [Xanthobacteraceae bacterium]|nr:GNAT family N-acetyltransferase [Xanthobacteraceae bacterium]
MARSLPTPALRPFLPTDGSDVVAIFRASIEELTEEDYGEAQREAWASMADDEEAFVARLARALTLVATMDGTVVGFISLEDANRIEMLYVHPAVARHGVGTTLCDAVEKIAASRGTTRLTTDASDSARDFFEHRGYVAQQRNSVSVGEEWLANTTMEKKLAAKGDAR